MFFVLLPAMDWDVLAFWAVLAVDVNNLYWGHFFIIVLYIFCDVWYYFSLFQDREADFIKKEKEKRYVFPCFKAHLSLLPSVTKWGQKAGPQVLAQNRKWRPDIQFFCATIYLCKENNSSSRTHNSYIALATSMA